MSNCSNHRKDVHGETDIKHLAEEVGNLHYESFAYFIKHLSDKVLFDSLKDEVHGRDKLANQLAAAANHLHSAGYHIESAWQISAPFMSNNDQEAQASVASTVDSTTSGGKQNNSSNSGEQQPGEVGIKVRSFLSENKLYGSIVDDIIDELILFIEQDILPNRPEIPDSSQPPTSEPAVTGELYWKQRCLAAEAYIPYLVEVCNFREKKDDKKMMRLYTDWQQLKNQEVEPGKQTSNQRTVEGL